MQFLVVYHFYSLKFFIIEENKKKMLESESYLGIIVKVMINVFHHFILFHNLFKMYLILVLFTHIFFFILKHLDHPVQFTIFTEEEKAPLYIQLLIINTG